MFELEKAIKRWRQRMLDAGIKAPEALEELENHLRDDVEQQVCSGTSESEAFENAVRQLGQPVALRKEYAKAGRPKRELLRKLRSALFGFGEIPFPSLENLAPAARESLELAPDEARRFHHDFVGTEHVLLGLAQSQSGVVSNVMRRLGVSAPAIRVEIEKIVSSGPAHDLPIRIPFTPRARKALQLAAAEARKFGQSRVNAEHIFLGLILEGSGVAALVLKNLGVRIEAAREETLREMRANPNT